LLASRGQSDHRQPMRVLVENEVAHMPRSDDRHGCRRGWRFGDGGRRPEPEGIVPIRASIVTPWAGIKTPTPTRTAGQRAHGALSIILVGRRVAEITPNGRDTETPAARF
jgi:hypothetical protein